MSKNHMVLGVFPDHISAQHCVDALYEQGYVTPDINVLMSEGTRANFKTEEEREEIKATESHGLEGIGVGGAIGTVVGASLAAIAAIGTTLLIPGLSLVVAGPIVAALAGGGAGAVAGGVIGGLAGLGFTEQSAAVYHTALREGGTVIGVNLRQNGTREQNTAEAEEAQRIMETCGGKQVGFINK